MEEQRYAEIDQLSDLMDAIQLGRKTGTLLVIRGEGRFQESGAIVFVNGQPIQARVGLRSPMESLHWLKTWRQCSFIFIPGQRVLPPPDWRGEIGESGPAQNTLSGSTNASMPVMPTQRMPAAAYSPLLAMPHRLWPVNEAVNAMDHLGFSRNHRRLFLLLDGQHSVKDLSLLTGRSPEEIFILLDQLEKAGFIQM